MKPTLRLLAVVASAATMTACGPFAPPITTDTPTILVEATAITACQTVNWTIQVLKDGIDVTSNYTFTALGHADQPAVTVPSFNVTDQGRQRVIVAPFDSSDVDTYRYTLTCQAKTLSTTIDVPVTKNFLQPVNVRYANSKMIAQF
ncbi:hypothetical protein [Deinococcus sp. RM]|uniref:hypothetical protein n=1 Tax=Deinococcus sp. RM TaxID=2316359 RepID=UPI0011C23984|nr:hypothetical protein [Deinococcus sp. RM]